MCEDVFSNLLPVFYEISHAMSNVYFVHVDLMPLQNIIAATIEYTSQRQAFGRPVLNNQVVHFRYSEKTPDSSSSFVRASPSHKPNRTELNYDFMNNV